MSGPKCIDHRTTALQDAQALLSLAMSQLGAIPTGVGHAEVSSSALSTTDAAQAFANMYAADLVDTNLREDLQARLANASAVDYDPSALGEFKPKIAMPKVAVDVRGADNGSNVKLVGHVAVPGMGNHLMGIFEIQHTDGTTSAAVGLDDLLFNEAGEWKDDSHRQTYEGFLKQAFRLQDQKQKALDGGPAKDFKQDLKRRGFEVTRQKAAPAQHTVVSRPAADWASSPKKTRTAGE
jgi:hypothetical protein